MGRTAQARGALAGVLEAVLPGRVYPYPPSLPALTAPAIYVGVHGQSYATDIDWVATFAVIIAADGADRAAHAQLDDLVDAVYDTVAGSDDFFPDSVTYEPLETDGTTTLPAYTFGVQVELSMNTWCAPDPPAAAVPIPVTPIGALTDV